MNVRFTLEFTRAAATANRDPGPSVVSVVLPKEDATYEKAVEYARGLLPQGPVWKDPFLVSIIESED